MVTSTVERVSPTRVKLHVAVTLEDLKPGIDQAYKTIAEQISIPGFRKGKVPAPIIDQRVGRETVIQEAINGSLDDFYREAVAASEVRPLGRPSADVEELLDPAKPESELKLLFEVSVRPEFTLPAYEGVSITVDDVEISDEDVETELERLRTPFGTLVTVDRPAEKGDFVSIDLVATIDGVEVDRATGISYELGSGELLEGIDEALDSLTAGETTTFRSTLLGGDHEGEEAEIEVTVTAVKVRELPEADDEFAQIASEFDTIEELRGSLREQVARRSVFEQGRQARDKLVELLLEQADIPPAPELVEDEVHRHLEAENRLEDEVHRAEVAESSAKAFATQILLDAIAEKEGVQPTQNELSQYIYSSAAQYGMDPNQFLSSLNESGQLPAIIGEVTRNKALAVALGKATVVTASGGSVDLSEFTAVDSGDAAAEDHSGHDHD